MSGTPPSSRGSSPSPPQRRQHSRQNVTNGFHGAGTRLRNGTLRPRHPSLPDLNGHRIIIPIPATAPEDDFTQFAAHNGLLDHLPSDADGTHFIVTDAERAALGDQTIRDLNQRLEQILRPEELPRPPWLSQADFYHLNRHRSSRNNVVHGNETAADYDANGTATDSQAHRSDPPTTRTPYNTLTRTQNLSSLRGLPLERTLLRDPFYASTRNLSSLHRETIDQLMICVHGLQANLDHDVSIGTGMSAISSDDFLISRLRRLVDKLTAIREEEFGRRVGGRRGSNSSSRQGGRRG